MRQPLDFVRGLAKIADDPSQVLGIARREEFDHSVAEVALDRGRLGGDARKPDGRVFHELRRKQTVREDVVAVRDDAEIGAGDDRRQLLCRHELVSQLDAVLDPQLVDELEEFGHLVAPAEDGEADLVGGVGEQPDGTNRQVEPVSVRDRPVIEQPVLVIDSMVARALKKMRSSARFITTLHFHAPTPRRLSTCCQSSLTVITCVANRHAQRSCHLIMRCSSR